MKNLKGNKYNVIIISHVLEHILDLEQAVINLKQLVSENGFIYVEVPDASRYHEHFIVPYYFFDCEHINHFDANSISNLFLDKEFSLSSVNERQMQVTNSIFYPVVSCIFKKTSNTIEGIKSSDKVKTSIEKYIQFSNDNSDNIELNGLKFTQEKIAVWGAGMYTLRMLKDSALVQCNIVNFLDKDSNKQGHKINDIEILEPQTFLKDNLI